MGLAVLIRLAIHIDMLLNLCSNFRSIGFGQSFDAIGRSFTVRLILSWLLSKN